MELIFSMELVVDQTPLLSQLNTRGVEGIPLILQYRFRQ